jgi:hypothetical protein
MIIPSVSHHVERKSKCPLDNMKDIFRYANKSLPNYNNSIWFDDSIRLCMDVPVWAVPKLPTTSTLVSRDSGLAHFSDLYRQIDILDNKVTLFSMLVKVSAAKGAVLGLAGIAICSSATCKSNSPNFCCQSRWRSEQSDFVGAWYMTLYEPLAKPLISR